MIVVLLVGGILGLICLFLSMRAIFNEKHVRVQSTLVASPVKSFAAGLGVALATFGVFIGLIATGVPPLAILSIAIAAVVGAGIIFGLGTVAGIVGEKVLTLRNQESSPFAQTSTGTVVLALMAGLPFLGWFLIGPVAAILGLGAVAISLTRRNAENHA